VEVGIHIADPCAFIAAEGVVDAEARARGTTYYFSRRQAPDDPAAISEGAASLVAGSERPALSFLVTIDTAGRVASSEIVRSIVRVATRLDYDAVDATLQSGSDPTRTCWALFSRWRRAARPFVWPRERSLCAAPETEIRVAADGSMTLSRRDPDTPAQKLVSEA
jgi:exoribonuclease-2